MHADGQEILLHLNTIIAEKEIILMPVLNINLIKFKLKLIFYCRLLSTNTHGCSTRTIDVDFCRLPH